MNAIDFINELEKTEFLKEKTLRKLRRQIEKSTKDISAEQLGRLLVKNELLTRTQAKSVLKAVQQSTQSPEDELADLNGELDVATDDELDVVQDDELDVVPDDDELDVVPDDDELDVVPDDDELGVVPDDELDVVPDDELDVTQKVEPAPTGSREVAAHEDTAELIEDDAKHGEGMSDALHDHLDDSEHDEAVSAAPSGKKTRRRRYNNRWDSPLMMVGGGALLFMIFIGGLIWFYFLRGNANDAFTAADQDYQDGNYTQAASKFEEFVSKFPKDDNVSRAKVYTALSRIWGEVNRGNWEDALNKVRIELPAVEPEDAFDEGRSELAIMLPKIMRGFAEDARDSADAATAERLLDLSKDASKEVNNSAYLPTRFRDDLRPKLDEINGIMDTVERRLNESKELATALQSIQDAVADSDTGKAYQLRLALIRDYPSLENNSELRAIISEITDKERERVRPLAELPAATKADHDSSSLVKVALAATRGKSAEGLDGVHVYVKAKGAVYALAASTGAVSWRRFVGFESTTHPQPVSREPNSDVIVVDSQRDEVLRLAAATGKLVWRLPCTGKIARPTIDRGRMLVSCVDTGNGQVLSVDLESGKVNKAVTFPMGLTSPAYVDAETGTIYQPGIHSSLYVLDGVTLECRDVVYLGQGEDSINVAPVKLMGHIVVAENPAPNFSLLHILAPNAEDEGTLREVMKPIRLSGGVVVPMIPTGRRLIVTTDRGAVDVFEIDPRNAETPVKKAVSGLVPTSQVTVISYPYFQDGQFWVGDSQFACYELQASRGVLSRKWIRNKGDVYVGPMQRIGDTLISLRQRRGKRGITVASTAVGKRGQDGEELWETDLAVPPAGQVFVNAAAKQLNVVNANCDFYALGRSELGKPIVGMPSYQIPSATLPVLQTSLDLGQGRRAFFSNPPTEKSIVYDPKTSPALKEVNLSIGGDRPSAGAVVFGQSVVIPTASGSVYAIDPFTGMPAAHEFQPALSSGQKINWTRPSVSDDVLVMADGQNRLFKVGLAQDPQPHLQAVAQSETGLKPFGQLATVGETTYAAQRGVGTDTIVAINLADLTSSQNEWSLSGRVNWGPARIGDVVLVTSDANELVCLDAKQDEKWRVELPYGPLAGAPVVVGKSFLLSSIHGTVWQIDSQTGATQKSVDLTEPLGTSVVPYGSRMIVLGGDGTLHVFTMK